MLLVGRVSANIVDVKIQAVLVIQMSFAQRERECALRVVQGGVIANPLYR